jgi:hypothetical protein
METTTTDRKMIDCGQFAKSPQDCTLQITGRTSEVIDAAVAHAVAKHGHHDGPELRAMLSGALKDA